MKRKYIFPVLYIILVSVLIFFPTFVNHLYPFPGDFLIAWFEPWKSNFSTENFISISHKPIADDIFRQLYPFKVLAMRLFGQLQLPLWNPYNGSGMPLFATMHVGFLNPFNSIFLFLSEKTAWTVYIILQPILIGLLLYLYCRKLTISPLASLFAAIAFILSGFVIARTIYGDYDYAIAGFILLLYTTESFIQNQHKKILIIPPAIFLIITSTQPQIIFYFLGFTVFYFLYRSYQSRSIKKVFLFFIFILIGVGLTAIQLIPTIELLQFSNITAESSRFIIDRFLLPPQHFISLLIPNYFGNQSTYNYWGTADYVETITAVGTIPVFFSFLAFTNKSVNKKIIIFFAVGTLICIFLTIDSLITRVIYSLPLPILSTSIPSRILVLAVFSIAVLSAVGFDSITKKEISIKSLILRTSPFLMITVLIVFGTILFYVRNISCHNNFVLNCRSIALRNSIFELSFFGFFLLILTVYLFIGKNRKLHLFFSMFCIILITIIGLYNAHKFLPFTTEERILPETKLIKSIKNVTVPYRTFGFGKANIKTNFATYFSFYDPNYYDPLYISRYAELIAYGNTKNINQLKRSDIEISNGINISKPQLERRKRLLNILGVKNFIYDIRDFNRTKNTEQILYEDKNWIILNNSESFPRAYLVNNAIILQNNDILSRLFDPSFDIKNSAIVETNISLGNFSEKQGTTLIKKYSENNVEIITRAPDTSLLVLTDNYFPGWRAYIDNNEVTIHRVNYSFRGVVVPKGNHIVSFKYNPISLKIGAAFSLISLFIYFFLIVFWKKITRYKKNRKIS